MVVVLPSTQGTEQPKGPVVGSRVLAVLCPQFCLCGSQLRNPKPPGLLCISGPQVKVTGSVISNGKMTEATASQKFVSNMSRPNS